ncbi:MAG: hypothetical protein HY537_18025 [Deltaproteobacteria bacterium]|nr:hypothetical protein [Deltaproteobacteria bacterium]
MKKVWVNGLLLIVASLVISRSGFSSVDGKRCEAVPKRPVVLPNYRQAALITREQESFRFPIGFELGFELGICSLIAHEKLNGGRAQVSSSTFNPGIHFGFTHNLTMRSTVALFTDINFWNLRTESVIDRLSNPNQVLWNAGIRGSYRFSNGLTLIPFIVMEQTFGITREDYASIGLRTFSVPTIGLRGQTLLFPVLGGDLGAEVGLRYGFGGSSEGEKIVNGISYQGSVFINTKNFIVPFKMALFLDRRAANSDSLDQSIWLFGLAVLTSFDDSQGGEP